MEKIAKEPARILAPIPARERGEAEEHYAERHRTASERRRALTGELVLTARAAEQDDPVLARLNELSAQKQEIQEQIGLAIAYGREFVRP